MNTFTVKVTHTDGTVEVTPGLSLSAAHDIQDAESPMSDVACVEIIQHGEAHN